jgi:hypothetical protein
MVQQVFLPVRYARKRSPFRKEAKDARSRLPARLAGRPYNMIHLLVQRFRRSTFPRSLELLPDLRRFVVTPGKDMGIHCGRHVWIGVAQSRADCVPVQREMESERSPLVNIPPLRDGDFQGMRVYRSDECLGRARRVDFRAQKHRFDEPAKLSLGMVASLQSPLPFHLAKSL